MPKDPFYILMNDWIESNRCFTCSDFTTTILESELVLTLCTNSQFSRNRTRMPLIEQILSDSRPDFSAFIRMNPPYPLNQHSI
jgi:hypothetical protein